MANSDLGRQSTVESLTLHPDLQIYKSCAILLSTSVPCSVLMPLVYLILRFYIYTIWHCYWLIVISLVLFWVWPWSEFQTAENNSQFSIQEAGRSPSSTLTDPYQCSLILYCALVRLLTLNTDLGVSRSVFKIPRILGWDERKVDGGRGRKTAEENMIQINKHHYQQHARNALE